MIEHLLLFFALLAIIALVMVSNRLKVAYPVLLVLGGLAISFVPNLPSIKIDPELIFIIFLPPLLYEAAWANSLKELFKWRRMIGSFAFIVVFISAAAVAVIANLVIPGFSLALGFMLGAIVSPPDAVNTAAILKFVKAPRRISAILEGESLLMMPPRSSSFALPQLQSQLGSLSGMRRLLALFGWWLAAFWRVLWWRLRLIFYIKFCRLMKTATR